MRQSWTFWTSGSIAALLAVSGASCAFDEAVADDATVGETEQLVKVTDRMAGSYIPEREIAPSRLPMARGAADGPSTAAAGDPLPGTDPDAFAEAAEAFAALETIDDGVGPLFNEVGCGACHTTPALGGSGENIERRFGRNTNGRFFGFDQGPEDNQGTLRQLFSNGTYQNGTTTCTVPLEVEPASANIRNVGRRTTSLLGLGLVDAMPDAVFPQIQATQPAAVRGIIVQQRLLLPDERDRTQGINSLRTARFGWKNQIANLTTFAGDAYVNEMGITTQSCFRGTSLLAFATEQIPNNQPIAGDCNGGDLAPPQPAGNGIPTFVDDAVGSCAGGLTELQDDLHFFRTFMEALAPAPRDLRDQNAVQFGPRVFAAVGCDGCHVTGTYITPSNPFNGVPGRAGFRPFGDFMLHDMGSLGDLIGNTGDSTARTRLMRTAPLWGARFQTSFLHDGSETTVRGAIGRHDGTARTSRDAFLRLSRADQDLLLRYVNTL